MPTMTMIEAIRDAHAVAMERDDRVVVFGEDVGYFGGVPLHSQIMHDIESARVLAHNWRDTVRAIELRS